MGSFMVLYLMIFPLFFAAWTHEAAIKRFYGFRARTYVPRGDD